MTPVVPTPPHTATRRSSRLLAAGLVVGLLGTAGATAAFGLSQAGEAPAAVVQADDESTSPVRPERGDRLREALAPLVDNGTITQAQADAVVEQLLKQAPERSGRPWHHGRGGPHGRGGWGQHLAAVADQLGLSTQELRAALRDGATLAELADEAGVEVEALVETMLAPLQERLDAAVAAGRLSQERADRLLERATERFTAWINGERPGRGPLPD